ncbi:MAG: CHAT domain-containing protein, partial [Planctomycetota bacterium]
EWRERTGRGEDERSPDIGTRVEAGPSVGPDPAVVLREILLDPVTARLPDARVLYLVPDDCLYLVPFDALPDGDGVVGDRLRIRVSSSVCPLVGEGEIGSGLVVVGDVDYDAPGPDTGTPVDTSESFESLDETGDEALAIERMFESTFERPVIALTREAAAKGALARAVVGARFIHLATHGWFSFGPSGGRSLEYCVREDSDAERFESAQATVVGLLPESLCGLALAGANHGPDGILTAEELATFDLSRCELAVLSACETNVGVRRAGQGIQSLQSALLAAGARTAITSLWKVGDAATRRLFELFYAKLWMDGLGKADALWQAKMALRSEGYPIRDWAAWVLTGAPD